MTVLATSDRPGSISLQDKWEKTRGRIFLNGTQALVRILLLQKQIDERGGLDTAGYISGYRGSPLGGVDLNLWSIADQLKARRILFDPGLNEDMAATAVRGTQQIDAVPNPKYDGVFAAWYGKGPGVDRSGDALKHGNFKGAHRNGGVLLFYGDDHAGKSSTVAHHSEQAMAAAFIPSFYPANVAEILEYGVLGFAMSRFSGSWVGLKCVNEVVEQTASVDLSFLDEPVILPEGGDYPPEGVHCREGAYAPLRDEQIVVDYRLPLVHQFVRANRIDRAVIASTTPRLGLVSAGKSYGDTRQALALLGLSDDRAAELGISLYKVGCIWPLEPQQAIEFSRVQQTIFVIEEKKSFVEAQLASILFNLPERPRLIGKTDRDGSPLLSTTLSLEPFRIAAAIADELERLGIDASELAKARAAFPAMAQGAPLAPLARRIPFFCSGCPHGRSTRVPDGSLAMTGIGCHSMVALSRPAESLHATHMGGEGGNWIGLAPFTDTRHIFQNMGDGTYYHSGLLAIRAAIAAGVNITYKILYNDAVAMTGGQPVDGPISVAQIARQVRDEGVKTIVLVSDNPEMHRKDPDLPADVRIAHRVELDAVQRELREQPGCTILIYEQTCAAEKRRRRKKKQYPDPPKRLFIASEVCEGCGDCSVQSTCVSLLPRETDLGLKRQIDQSSCNKDYSCQEGFCPSFITVHGAEPRRPARAEFGKDLFDGLAAPEPTELDNAPFNIMITGIGGTGVITVAAIIAMAAHLQGLAVSTFDMTGLAQKNGAVFSHVRIAPADATIHAQRIGRGESDVLLAFDMVGALADEAFLSLAPYRTRAVVSTDVTPTMAFQFQRDAVVRPAPLLDRLTKRLGETMIATIDATRLAKALLGDTIGANFFVVGYALQKGLLPIGVAAVEQAIELNGTAIAFNLEALRLGRLFAVSPDRIHALVPTTPEPDPSLAALIARRELHLGRYQDAAYAARYRRLVDRVREAEQRAAPGSEALALVVARHYAKLLAYKDEYEVARLLTDPGLLREIAQTFEPGGRLEFNMAPPLLGGKPVNGRPPKRAFHAAWMRPALKLLARMKGLRGSRLDPFGWTAERRMERGLIADYEMLVDEVLARLTPDNHAAAEALLDLGRFHPRFRPGQGTSDSEISGGAGGPRTAFETPLLHQAA